LTNDGNSSRRDEERNARLEALKAAIQEGLASGTSDKTVPGIMEEVEARLQRDGLLQTVEQGRRRSRRQSEVQGMLES
jgi:hypothetical protein